MVDAGNTTTLTHYLSLLQSAGLALGLENYSGSYERIRASSPKLHVFNTAFIAAMQSERFSGAKTNSARWGEYVEWAIGAHLANTTFNSNIQLFYWRKGNYEVDFVLKQDDHLIGIEIKTNSTVSTRSMTHFQQKYQPYKLLLVGPSGIPWQEFLKIDPEELF